MDRREFLAFSLAASLVPKRIQPFQLRFAHRQAQIPLPSGQNVFETAARIPGLSGVQLQMIWRGADISQGDQAAELKKQARGNGMLTPSLAGVWKHGENIFQAEKAERAIAGAIRAASALDARVILVAMFKQDCPQMNDAASYEPVVRLFRKMASRAGDAGTKLCTETSLTPEEDRALIEHIDRPSVGVYYDAANAETYHPGSSLAGIRILGDQIGEIHLKNEDRLLGQMPSKVNWSEALKAFREIRYDGWFCFETEHASPERFIEDTIANITFVREQFLSRA